jgi:Ni/Fe-hydrogenase subunit HybB-like protein
MIRQFALGLGLVLNFCGMIVFLTIFVNLGRYWIYSDVYNIGVWNMSNSVFLAFVALGVISIIAGFLLLCIGILFPHQTPEPASEEDIIKE